MVFQELEELQQEIFRDHVELKAEDDLPHDAHRCITLEPTKGAKKRDDHYSALSTKKDRRSSE